jgi:peptidoglycan/xylan/chitin deacetylase (PgdA/CDA1 family)
MSVSEFFTKIESGEPLAERAVVFTVDDGYADFADVAAPIFAAYDCPVTVFLITDFTSGKLWNWFDRIPWIINRTACHGVTVEIGGGRVSLGWRNLDERENAAEEIVERLKRVADVEKERLIGILAASLEVALPAGVPERDRAMSWDQVRSCVRHGVTFGAHTVTHPILSRVDSDRSVREVTESWRRVSEESGAPVPVFCYPNGTPADFSSREEAAVKAAGMRGAFSTVEASVTASGSEEGKGNRFAIPRFVYPASQVAFIQAASGLEAWRGRIVQL